MIIFWRDLFYPPGQSNSDYVMAMLLSIKCKRCLRNLYIYLHKALRVLINISDSYLILHIAKIFTLAKMTTKITAMVFLVLIQQYPMLAEGKVWSETKSFYIRHHFGKCIEYDPARKALVYVAICREKFRWSSGAHLLHIPTKKCVVVNSTADNSFVSLTSQCTDTKTLFRYDEAKRVLLHLISGKCLYPDAGATNPGTNSTIVIKQGCNEDASKYYFRPNAHYVIRHFGGLCWVHSAVDNLIRLKQPTVCDRFHYENDYKLKHVNTGKCITGTYATLSLTDDCSGTKSHLQPNSYSNIGNPHSACVHPKLAWAAPPSGVNLVLWPNGCNDANSIRFYFFDDTGIEHNIFCFHIAESNNNSVE